MIFFICIFLGFLAYTVFLAMVAGAWKNKTIHPADQNEFMPKTMFSIVVPFRNEAKNLPTLLESLKRLDYPADLLEIIFVDDHSTDQGITLIEEQIRHYPFVLRALHNSASGEGKKRALQLGIEAARHEYIITTDADCEFQTGHLRRMDELIQTENPNLIAGPVVYLAKDNNILSDYQIVENAGLIAITAYGFHQKMPMMANGANLSFRKQVFMDLGMYESNIHIPGGDDEFLLEQVAFAYPGTSCFSYSADTLVSTSVQPDFKNFLQQRIRWAAKVKHKNDRSSFLRQIIFFLLFLSVPLSIAGVFLDYSPFLIVLAPILKVSADLYFYRSIKHFFSLSVVTSRLVLISLMQLFIVPLIAVLSIRNTYNWKGRKFHT